MSGKAVESLEPVESREQLIDWIRVGEKPVSAYRVGTEHEKIGLHRKDGTPVRYEGENGIAALLEAIAREDGWERILEAGKLIALAKDGASITLEPGGQLELSGAPLRTTFETCAEFNAHLLDVLAALRLPPGADRP